MKKRSKSEKEKDDGDKEKEVLLFSRKSTHESNAMPFAVVHLNVITRGIKPYQESYAENCLEIIEWFYGAACYSASVPR